MCSHACYSTLPPLETTAVFFQGQGNVHFTPCFKGFLAFVQGMLFKNITYSLGFPLWQGILQKHTLFPYDKGSWNWLLQPLLQGLPKHKKYFYCHSQALPSRAAALVARDLAGTNMSFLQELIFWLDIVCTTSPWAELPLLSRGLFSPAAPWSNKWSFCIDLSLQWILRI